MKPEDLRSLLKKEKRLLNSLLELVESFVSDFDEERDRKEIEVRLQLLESVVNEFFEVRDKIEVLMDEVADDEVPDPEESEKARKARLESA